MPPCASSPVPTPGTAARARGLRRVRRARCARCACGRHQAERLLSGGAAQVRAGGCAQTPWCARLEFESCGKRFASTQ
eukprot:3215272-Pleurochrysis_carterae.AAC.1